MTGGAGRKRWPRRVFLAVAALGPLSAACGPDAARVAAPIRRPYWEPALTAATRALAVLRTVEANALAFARARLTADRFVTALRTQFDAIAELAELVIPLKPPADALTPHAHLVAAIDALTEVIPTVRAYESTDQLEQLVHVTTLAARTRSALTALTETLGPGRASDGLREIIEDLGEFELEIRRVPMLAVFVGPFDDEAQARSELSRFMDGARFSRVFQSWVEVARYADAAAAESADADWRARGFQTRVERVADVAFEVNVVRAARPRSWTEVAWLHHLDFDATHIASSDLGERIVAVGRSGKVAAFDASGASLWRRDLGIPLARASVHPSGEPIAVHGFDLQLLNADGEPLWPVPFRPDNQLLEQVLFDSLGTRLVVRSTNASGLGHVFAFNQSGQEWGPTREYIGAAWVDYHPATGTVGVGSSKLGENQVVLIQPNGNLDQRFGVEGNVFQVLFTRSGEETIALTSAGMQAFDSSTGDPLWHLRFPARTAARMPLSDTVVLGGEAGVGAFGADGREMWFLPGLVTEEVLTTRDYVVARVDESTLSIIRSDGTLLGQVATLAPIRSLAVAPGQNLVIAATTERNIQAWQPPHRQLEGSG